MNKIFIEKTVFSLDSVASKGLISGLKLLQENGFILSALKSSVSKTLLNVLHIENIDLVFERVPEEGSIVIGVEKNKTLIKKSSNTVKKFSDFISAAEYITNPERIAEVERNTKETKIKILVNLDGTGKSKIKTGIGFFDHMLDQIARHGNVDLNVSVKGDLHIDEHHTVEDTGIALGEAISSALGSKMGIKRYGFLLPMDESVAQCGLDLGGRTHLNFNCDFKREMVGKFPTELAEEFFAGLARGLKANIYIKAEGRNEHHKIEAMFKAFAKSLNEACRFDERSKGKLPSTKGQL